MIDFVWWESEFDNGTEGWICSMLSRRRRVGTAHVVLSKKRPRRACLAALEVEAQYQRLGYGKLLLQHVINWASPNYDHLWLSVQPFGNKRLNQQQLVDYYEAFGFVRIQNRAKWPEMQRPLVKPFAV